MLSKRQMEKIHRKRNINSYWIYFIHESPANARPPPGDYDGMFNLTMGYRTDADIHVPYNWEWGAWERRTRWAGSFEQDSLIDYAYS